MLFHCYGGAAKKIPSGSQCGLNSRNTVSKTLRVRKMSVDLSSSKYECNDYNFLDMVSHLSLSQTKQFILMQFLENFSLFVKRVFFRGPSWQSATMINTRQKVYRVEHILPIHRLTLPKGVYSLRYFLSPMRIPNVLMHVFIIQNHFVICSCIYAFCLRIAIRHSMRIPGIRIEV